MLKDSGSSPAFPADSRTGDLLRTLSLQLVDQYLLFPFPIKIMVNSSEGSEVPKEGAQASIGRCQRSITLSS